MDPADEEEVNEAEVDRAVESRSLPTRILWASLGLLCTGLGGLGVVLPGLPTTPFLLVAAACFARSSRRLYHWLLGVKGVGPAVRDFRAGRGVPKRAKLLAIVTIWTVVGLSLGLGMPAGWVWPRVVVAGLALVGTVTLLRLKTRM